MKPFMSSATVALGGGVVAEERTTGVSKRKWATVARQVASRSERKWHEGTMLVCEARVGDKTAASAGCM